MRQKCTDRRSFVEINSTSMLMDLNYINIGCGAYWLRNVTGIWISKILRRTLYYSHKKDNHFSSPRFVIVKKLLYNRDKKCTWPCLARSERSYTTYWEIWSDFDCASSLICGNKMPARCNRGFYCRSYCLLNMFRASLCPSSGAQEYYTVFAACGIWCCGFQVVGLVWSWGLCVRFAGCC